MHLLLGHIGSQKLRSTREENLSEAHISNWRAKPRARSCELWPAWRRASCAVHARADRADRTHGARYSGSHGQGLWRRQELSRRRFGRHRQDDVVHELRIPPPASLHAVPVVAHGIKVEIPIVDKLRRHLLAHQPLAIVGFDLELSAPADVLEMRRDALHGAAHRSSAPARAPGHQRPRRGRRASQYQQGRSTAMARAIRASFAEPWP
jgi:hypothetical protein